MNGMNQMDWPRIKHLYKLGIIGALFSIAGDIFLGYGVYDDTLTGFDRYLSRYITTPNINIFLAGLLGMIGITLATLSCFGIYRVIADEKKAHTYRSGVIGVSIFGACGCHVPLCAAVYFLKKLTEAGAANSLETVQSYFLWLVLPPTVIFFVAYIVMVVTQIKVFTGKHTPYPIWCWIFNPLMAFVFNGILALCGNVALINGLKTAYLGLGYLWMFAGLLIMSKKAETKQ